MTRRRPVCTDLVRRGLAANADEASELVAAHRVLANGAVVMKDTHQVAPADSLRVLPAPKRFVSRGALKLGGALDRFGIDPSGMRCLDIGASTGGFTDCLLQRGAASVIAADIGTGLLHERLIRDPRVLVWDRTHVRDLPDRIPAGSIDLVVADLSFITVKTVAKVIPAVCRTDGIGVLLVKPQFEVSAADADRGRGIIVDPELWASSIASSAAAFAELGSSSRGCTVSPVTGAAGNVEFFLHVHNDGAGARLGDESVAAAVTAARRLKEQR